MPKRFVEHYKEISEKKLPRSAFPVGVKSGSEIAENTKP